MSSHIGRVALVVPSFPKLSETFVVRKALGLVDRGIDVQIVAGRLGSAEDWAAFPEAKRSLRGRVHLAPNANRRDPRVLASVPTRLWSTAIRNRRATLSYLRRGLSHFGTETVAQLYLDSTLVRLAPQIVHFEFGALARGRMHLGSLLGAKIVVSFRGYDINHVGVEDPRYYEDVFSRADAFHFLGEALKDRAHQRGLRTEKTAMLIPPAIDVADYVRASEASLEAKGTEARPIRLLSVGRLEWKKGYEFALSAVRRLVDSGVHVRYRIIGSGSYLEALSFARHQLGLTEQVELVGPLSPSAVRAELERADLFVHPAVSEGFCNAVLEAQAMMLPVVCSDAGGLPENVADGESGFVVPRRDPERMAERIAVLAKDGALRQSMGTKGRARVVGSFSIDRQISSFIELYRRARFSAGVAA